MRDSLPIEDLTDEGTVGGSRDDDKNPGGEYGGVVAVAVAPLLRPRRPDLEALTVVIVIRSARARSPEDAEALCALFAHSYTLKITPGFIRGDCAIKVDDPCAVVGIEYWGTKAALAAFTAREDTRRTFAESAVRLVTPIDVAEYEVGP